MNRCCVAISTWLGRVALGVSFLLMLATIGYWIRSYWVDDELAVGFVTVRANTLVVIDWRIRSGRGFIIAERSYSRLSSADYFYPEKSGSHSRFLSTPRVNAYPIYDTDEAPYGFGFRQYQGHSSADRFRRERTDQTAIFPIWILTLPAAPIPAFWLFTLVRRKRARRRRSSGHCGSCGYNLAGNTSGVCPECGAAVIAQENVVA